MTYQSSTFVGNLGRDPELKYLSDGKAVCNFSLAIAGHKKDDKPMWVKVTVWERKAETCNQYLSKGSKVLVTGNLAYDQATGAPRTFSRQDGTVGASFELTAHEVRFLSGQGGQASDMPSQDAPAPVHEEDEIAF